MRITGEVANPDEVRVTLTMTGTAKEWREFREQLSTHWPSADVSRGIQSVIWKTLQQTVQEKVDG